MRFNFTHSTSTTCTHVHACTHTCTDVCMAYWGRHACQQCWRALSWLLLNQPFPPQKERGSSGRGGREIMTVWTPDSQHRVIAAGWRRLEQGKNKCLFKKKKEACFTWTPAKVGFSGNAVCRCPNSPMGQIITSAVHINDVTVQFSYCRNLFEAIRQTNGHWQLEHQWCCW